MTLINASLTRIIDLKVVRFTVADTEKAYNIQDLRSKANDYIEFYLGEDVARHGLFDLKIINKNSKKIENSFFDKVKINDRYLITERVAFFNLTRIKLPTIIKVDDYGNNESQIINSILMERTDGLGSLATISEPASVEYLSMLGISENGIYTPIEFKAVFDRDIIQTVGDYLLLSNDINILDIQMRIIKHIIKDIELHFYILDFGLYQYSFTHKLDQDLLYQFLRSMNILKSNEIFNENLIRLHDVSTQETNSCYIYSENYFQIEKDVNDELMVMRFSLIEHFLIERNYLLSSLSSLNVSNLDILGLRSFRERYLEFSRIETYYRFSISKNVESANLIKRIFGIDQIYEEVEKVHKYYLSLVEENEEKQKERRNRLLSIISLLVSVPSMFAIIDVLYNLEVPKIVFFPINCSKLILLIFTWIFLLLLIRRDNSKKIN